MALTKLQKKKRAITRASNRRQKALAAQEKREKIATYSVWIDIAARYLKGDKKKNPFHTANTIARKYRLKGEGGGCGEGRCDASYETKNCKAAAKAMKALRAFKIPVRVYAYKHQFGKSKQVRSLKCPR